MPEKKRKLTRLLKTARYACKENTCVKFEAINANPKIAEVKNKRTN